MQQQSNAKITSITLSIYEIIHLKVFFKIFAQKFQPFLRFQTTLHNVRSIQSHSVHLFRGPCFNAVFRSQHIVKLINLFSTQLNQFTNLCVLYEQSVLNSNWLLSSKKIREIRCVANSVKVQEAMKITSSTIFNLLVPLTLGFVNAAPNIVMFLTDDQDLGTTHLPEICLCTNYCGNYLPFRSVDLSLNLCVNVDTVTVATVALNLVGDHQVFLSSQS